MTNETAASKAKIHPVFIAVGAIFVVLKIAYAVRAMLPTDSGGIHVIVGSDTPTYTTASKTSLFSLDFYKAPGAFIFPLMLKVLGRNLRLIVITQTLISIGSWIALAFSLRQAVRTSLAKLVAFAGILATGLAPAFVMYDVAIATESLAISSTCLTIAIALRLAINIDNRTTAALLAAVFFAAFVRDINAIIAGCLGIVALVALSIPRWRRTHSTRLIASGVILIVIGATAMSLSSAANRSYWPIAETITLRIAEDPVAYRWLVDEGMPDDGAVRTLQANYFLTYPAFQSDDPYYQPLRRWLDNEGQATYMKYLLTHPGFVVTKPLEMMADQFTPNLEPIATAQGMRPDPVTRAIGKIGLPPFRLTAAWAAVAFMGLISAMWLAPGIHRRIGFVILGIGLIAIPHALAVFHGDSLELARHSLGNAVQARVFVWAATAFALDVFMTRRQLGLASTTTMESA